MVHTIPAFYTSQMCSGCHKIDKNNLKEGRRYICECGCNLNRDENASKNNKCILERFSNILCKKNRFNEYEAINFIKKEYVFQILSGLVPLSCKLD